MAAAAEPQVPPPGQDLSRRLARPAQQDQDHEMANALLGARIAEQQDADEEPASPQPDEEMQDASAAGLDSLPQLGSPQLPALPSSDQQGDTEQHPHGSSAASPAAEASPALLLAQEEQQQAAATPAAAAAGEAAAPAASPAARARPGPGANGRKVSTADVQAVQNLIEKCLQSYMTQREVIAVLQQQAKVEPAFTELVWQKLEEQNPDFFLAYLTRLKLKDQINLFNHLLEQQVHAVQQLQAGWMPPGAVAGMRPQMVPPMPAQPSASLPSTGASACLPLPGLSPGSLPPASGMPGSPAPSGAAAAGRAAEAQPQPAQLPAAGGASVAAPAAAGAAPAPLPGVPFPMSAPLSAAMATAAVAAAPQPLHAGAAVTMPDFPHVQQFLQPGSPAHSQGPFPGLEDAPLSMGGMHRPFSFGELGQLDPLSGEGDHHEAMGGALLPHEGQGVELPHIPRNFSHTTLQELSPP